MVYTPSFWAMSLANLCHTASFSAFVLLPLYILDHGGSEGDVGVVMGVFALASAVCRPWISEMIDRIGRKRSYTLGSIIMVISPLAYLGLEDPVGGMYLLLLLLRVIHGIGMAICFTAVFTFMADILPKERLNEGLGMFGIGGLLGIAIGPLLAEKALDHFGYPGIFLVGTGLALLALLVQQPIKESYRDEPLQAGDAAPAKVSFFALLGRRKFIVVGLLSLLFGLGVGATIGFVAPLADLRDLGLVSIYYFCYSGGAIVTRVFGGRLADRYGENRILPYGLLIFIAGLLLLPFVYGRTLFCLAGFAAGGGHGLIFPTLNTMAVRDEPAAVRGKVTGIFTGGIDTGVFAGSLLLGYIGDWFGLNVLFFCAGLMMALGLFLFRFHGRQKDLTPA